jgi:Zn-finger nucleic acid-binding protein
MNCPRCERAALDERDRDGVVVDVCGTCRGIWLDRGELEKLIARATREFDELASRRDLPPEGRYRDDDDDDDRRDPRDPRRKRRWFESFGDMFD